MPPAAPAPRRRPPPGPSAFHRRNRLALAAALAILAVPLADTGLTVAAGLRAQPGACRVLSVTDGDTVTLWCPGRGAGPARLTGYDAPELFSPGCAAEWWAGMRATWALRRMLWTAGTVRALREGTDRYGRALVALWLDGRPVAQAMIAAGHGRPYAGGPRGGWCAAPDPRPPATGRLPQIGRG